MNTSTFRLRAVVPIVAVLCWVLLQSAGAEAGRTLVVVNDAVGSDFNADDDCIVHDFTPIGQALHASGSTGGVFPHDSGWVYRDGRVLATLLPSNDDVDVLRTLGDHHDHAVIIVLDDFRVAAEGSGSFDDALRIPGRPDGFVERVSHGSMVMAHINALIRDTNAFYPVSSSGMETSWQRADGTGTIDVLGQQLEGNISGGYILFDDTVRNQLTPSSLMDVARSPTVLVVNMSWVILPCANINDLEAYMNDQASPSFANYEAALKHAAEKQGIQWMPRDYLSPSGASPLDDPIDRSAWAETLIVFVAASGNQGLRFELYPAAFPSVISVGARQPGMTDKEGYSNAARTMATGGWFPLTYLCCDGGTTNGTLNPLGAGLAYAGTSFAAPSMSVFSALNANECAHKVELRATTDDMTSPLYYDRSVCD